MLQKTYICPITRKRVRIDDATSDGAPTLEFAEEDALPAGWGSLRVTSSTNLRHLLSDDIAKMEEGAAKANEEGVSAEERTAFLGAKAQFDAVLDAFGDRAVTVVHEFGELSDEGLARIVAAFEKEGIKLAAPGRDAVQALLQSALSGGTEEEEE